MNAIDFNCFAGGWPFHKVRNNSFQQILRLHQQNGISCGYISSTNAIFYNDPYEAEKELHEEIKDSDYQHIMTVNPTLPGTFDDIKRAVKEFNISGVRILPGFHDYGLDQEPVKKLCEVLKSYGLPLFLTLRMEDERVSYLFHPKSVPMDEVSRFLTEEKGLKILLCNIRMDELFEIKETLLKNPQVSYDSSGLKDLLFPLERLIEYGIIHQMVYGSLAPVFSMKSTLLLIQADEIDGLLQERILSGKNFFGQDL